MIDKLKRDTDINWAKAVNFVPKKDEVIIYDCKDSVRMKIGNGIDKVGDLPFTEKNYNIEDDTLVID